jgi:hypothetical protein
VATSSYNLDSAWYAYSAATNHITSDLDKLTTKENYGGQEQVHASNGAGMMIKHIDHSMVSTPSRPIHLNNVLHVPQATRNLAYVHHLTSDNECFLELHPTFFLVKDQHTRHTLLHSHCRNDLYPIPPVVPSSTKLFLPTAKPSTLEWHGRLGHPYFKIVSRVLQFNKLPFVSNKQSGTHICDACQQAKSHQLPFPKSISVSKAPLELVFSDVWGPAPSSFGNHSYYVLFINDFSKFTWIYLLKHKFEVFDKFQSFQAHVERLFNCKILAMQTDWGVNTRN